VSAVVHVEVLGHLIFFMPEETRSGSRATSSVPVGTPAIDVPSTLGIPKHEVQAVVVNDTAVTDPGITLDASDRVVIMPVVISG